MGTKWTDVFFRDNLSDAGDYPTSGIMSQSPDIIPYGTSPYNGDAVDFFVVQNWMRDLGKVLTARMDNYIYLRASNLSGKEQTGKLYLYYSPAALLLYPTLWQNNVIKTGNGQDHFDFRVGKDGKLVSIDEKQGAFVWDPAMISNDHYCLIGRIVTPDHPNPISELYDVVDLGKFVSNNLNYAWRNVAVIDKDSPNYTTIIDYDQGTTKADIHFMIRCTNVPVGAEVSMTCSQPGTTPSLNIPRSKITNPESELFGMVCQVPANWKAKVNLNFWANGKIPQAGFDIRFEAVIVVNDAAHPLYEYGKTPEELGIPQHIISGVGPTKGICLGAYSIKGV